MIIRRSKNLIASEITQKLIKSCIAQHQTGIARWDKLDRYYRGDHDILKREVLGEFAPNNKIVHNFPKYITDMVTGYMFGTPVSYKPATDIEDLTEAFKQAESSMHDSEIGKDLSVFGEALELVYMSTDEIPVPKLVLIDPRNGFVVYDDTVEGKPLFGITYHATVDEDGEPSGYSISVYDVNYIYQYTAKTLTGDLVAGEVLPNVFAGVLPITQFRNNEETMGDFESVLTLVDAYNVLQSDRINDKERFVQALLIISNGELHTNEDTGELTEESKTLLANGILQLPEGATADYLTKTMNEGEIEVLRNSIVSDIHKFSQIPDFSDEQFAGNSSGVALAYKLLSIEYLSKVKERFFTSGLKARIKIFTRYLQIISRKTIDPNIIEIVFNRNLPVNALEMAQIVQTLGGKVSLETLLTQIPFVKDIPTELEKLKLEQEEKAKREAEAINVGGFEGM